MKRTGLYLVICSLLVIVLLTSCARQHYTLAPAPGTTDGDSSCVTPTGEKIGWEDIKRMPR